jgi:predicted AAA+ superfamily ATPase
MLARPLPSKLSALTGRFPVVFPAGPRQAGKTTLALATVPEFLCIPLEDLQNRQEAGEDPRGPSPRTQFQLTG